MNCDSVMLAETVEPMSLPLFQPLRLWNPRPVRNRKAAIVNTPVTNSGIAIPVKTFMMKGGYVNGSGGVRRMVIAGKIFKKEER